MKRTFSILLVASLVIAACSGDGGDTATTAASGESTTTSPEESSTTTAGDTLTTGDETSTTETSNTETSTTAGGSAGGDDCLVGAWVLDDEAFFEQAFADMDDEGFGEVTAVGGSFTTVLDADGSVEAVRADWGFSVDTEDGVFNIVINGTQTGTWETDGSNLLLTLDEGAGFDVEATVVVDGEEFPLPTGSMDVPTEALASSSEFTCSGDFLAVTSDGITSEFERS